MKKSNILIAVLSVLLILVSGMYLRTKWKNDWFQKDMDYLFTYSYNNLTLNMLNAAVENIGEAAVQRYTAENTRYSAIMSTCYTYTSFAENNNMDLNNIVAVLTQSSGYNAVTEIDMDLELYHSLKEVPADGFNNEEILKKAKTDIAESILH